MHRGKVDPGVSELPRGNELSRDHVNRPLEHAESENVHKFQIPLCEIIISSEHFWLKYGT